MDNNYKISFDRNGKIKKIVVSRGDKTFVREITNTKDNNEYIKQLDKFIVDSAWFLSTPQEILETTNKKVATILRAEQKPLDEVFSKEEIEKLIKCVTLEEKRAYSKAKSDFYQKYASQNYDILTKEEFKEENKLQEKRQKPISSKIANWSLRKKVVAGLVAASLILASVSGLSKFVPKGTNQVIAAEDEEKVDLKGKTDTHQIQIYH